MKKYIIGLIITVMILNGCHSGHDHSTDKKNNTSSHIHTDGDCHDHNHDHDDNHSHDHEKASDNGHTDEIVFTHEQAEAIGLQLENITPRSFHQVIKTSGQIQNQQSDEVVIAATADGIVSFSKPSFTEGSPIQQGESVISISAHNLPEGEQTSRIRVEYENAQSEYRRAESLVADKIISAREFEQIRSRYETARIAYEAQASNVTERGIQVKAPLSGYIKNRLVEQGEYVSVGQPVATIARNRYLQLRAEVSERYYKDLKNIRSAHFRTGYDPILYKLDNLNGHLLSYGKTADNQSFYIPVTFEFDNVGNILPGSFVEVWLIAGNQENTLTVPLSALTEEQGLYFVYLRIGDEEYKKQQVETGKNDGERVEIISGLNTGDQVVTHGVIQVKLAANAGLIPEGHSHSH